MNEYRVLQVALLISFSIHAAVIFNSRVLPFIKPPEIDKKIPGIVDNILGEIRNACYRTKTAN